VTLNSKEAEALLSDEAEVVVCAQGALADAKSLVESCLGAGIPAMISAKDCASGSCAPKLSVLVRSSDVEKVAQLMREEWMDTLEREGIAAVLSPEVSADENADPPCPACGTAAPLVEGACSDCGLQLE
jgi:hypothetical protein